MHSYLTQFILKDLSFKECMYTYGHTEPKIISWYINSQMQVLLYYMDTEKQQFHAETVKNYHRYFQEKRF